jgi:hypothetical protein
MLVFWEATPWALTGWYQRFGGTYCLRPPRMFLRNVGTYIKSTRCHCPKHQHWHLYRRENSKSHSWNSELLIEWVKIRVSGAVGERERMREWENQWASTQHFQAELLKKNLKASVIFYNTCMFEVYFHLKLYFRDTRTRNGIHFKTSIDYVCWANVE